MPLKKTNKQLEQTGINYPNLQPKSKKVAFFGGSFNPLHYGHLELLAFLKKNNLVDEAIVVPNCANPLEEKKKYLSKEIRWSILRQVFQKEGFHNKASHNKAGQLETFFHLWGYELFQKKAVFTAESIRLLKQKFSQKDFYLVLGSDSFERIDGWNSVSYLKENTHFIVFQREGFESIKVKNFASFKVLIPDKKISDVQSSDLIKEKKDYKSYAEEMKNQFQDLLVSK